MKCWAGLLVAVVTLSGAADSLHAGSPFPFGYSLGPTFGVRAYGSSVYSLGQVPVPPYFSLHPPVYYSYPVPRPYGFSPYALPPGVQPAEPIVAAEPIEILNPHAKPAVRRERESDRTAGVIVNPFYRGPAAQRGLAATAP